MREQEINCLEMANNYIQLKEFSGSINLKYENVQLESDLLIGTLKNLIPRDVHISSTLESTSGNYINNQLRRLYYGRLSFDEHTNVNFLRLQPHCSLRIECLPDGYFLGLTENEKAVQLSMEKRIKRYLLTWPKHVIVDRKKWTNDFDHSGKRWGDGWSYG